MKKERAISGSSEVLIFKLGNEEYGIDILNVQEIRGYDPVTTIANSPDYIKGVVNLRGTIVPIIDLRIKLQLGAPTYDALTVVIILNVGSKVIGMVVDGVSDVTTFSADQIKPVPEFGTLFSSDYIRGMGAVDERMVILLDIDLFMEAEQISVPDKIAA
ncbi:chemotaxis protein CheW [Herminiimonas sp. KBW02]|uniref:chemotaxis protein CheW n=1 Tax=Herminiimonas sp. KBW02 TaxID=2153363 RepID=UPI000F590C4E|nr:chemotaxis protein CheW [Herminiimonas sp. KBW02]RQO33533.1 chemotaxis protein CheW [Herminiimonas sp. KBW02]